MGSQEYLFHYACPPSFLSAVFFFAVFLAEWRIGGPAPIHIHEKFPSQRLSKNSL
jgi:hypothetical protein